MLASELIGWMVANNTHTPQRDSALKLASNMKTSGFIVNYYPKEVEKPFLDDSTLYQFCVCNFTTFLNGFLCSFYQCFLFSFFFATVCLQSRNFSECGTNFSLIFIR